MCNFYKNVKISFILAPQEHKSGYKQVSLEYVTTHTTYNDEITNILRLCHGSSLLRSDQSDNRNVHFVLIYSRSSKQVLEVSQSLRAILHG